tara:strand:+ start:935 stop:1414 length:480 start_codon:yes stop_codon:yes gene_type:complete
MPFQDENSVKQFKGDYFFLSNFYPHPMVYKGILYPSSEHAYVSAKSDDPEFKLEVSQLDRAGKAKNLGRELENNGGLIEDWITKKVIVMNEILRIKFSDSTLKSQLLSTDGQELWEGNWWHDNFFGYCNCDGCENKPKNNYLGKILMEIRNELKHVSIF